MPVAGSQIATFLKSCGGQSAINRCVNYGEKWSNRIDQARSLGSGRPGRQRRGGERAARRKVVLEMSHYSVQEVE